MTAKPLKGVRVAIVREFMVKHTKNDEAISDQMDKEIKKVLRDKLGAELVESVDPMYAGRSDRAQHEVHVPGCFRRNPPHNVPEYFWQKTASANSSSRFRAGT